MKTILLNLEEKHPIALFYGLTLLIAWPFILLAGYSFAGGMGEGIVSIIFGAALPALLAQFSPSIAGFLLVRLRYGKYGVVELWSRAWQLPDNLKWLLVAMLLPLVIATISMAIGRGIGWIEPTTRTWQQLFLSFPGYFLFFFIPGMVFGGLSEEFGWRGYLLPVLQRRYSAVISGIIVGLLWAIWHLEPEIMALPFVEGEGWRSFFSALSTEYAFRIPSEIAFSIVMVWLFNHTKGSLLPMLIIHASANGIQSAVTEVWEIPRMVESVYTALWGAVAIGLIVWQGYKHLNRDEARWDGVEMPISVAYTESK